MKARILACAALLALLTVLTACSSTSTPEAGPDHAACKTARAKQLLKEFAAGYAAPGKPPTECHGIDDKTMQRYTAEIIKKKLPPPRMPDIAPKCRAWIEKELLNNSDSIDAAPGAGPCGYMSKEQLDLTILRVSKDMTRQDATASP